MTYKINGTELTLQPTSGHWLPRTQLGIDGNGHPVYPSVYQFELRWELSAADEFNQLITFFDDLAITGSAIVDLPELRGSTYGFRTYSGCVVSEPVMDRYFAQHNRNVKLLITNINK